MMSALAGCGTEPAGPSPAPPQQAIEWHAVAWSGGTVNVALVRPSQPTPGPGPVLFGLPWGGGDRGLVESFIAAYWLTQPGARGYHVVVPEVLGPSLAASAPELLPALFAWMATEFSYDPGQVALVGASNGGRGLFHAALARPDDFAALLGMPARYDGPPEALAALVGTPIRLMVGEADASWVAGTEATAAALRAQGIEPRVDVVPGQGHVLTLNPVPLVTWIDEALGR